MSAPSPVTASRVALAGVDQVISGATNTLFVLFVGRSLSLTSFGALAVALIVYGLVLSVLFSFVTEPAVRDIVAGAEWTTLAGVYSTSTLTLAVALPVGVIGSLIAPNETTQSIGVLLIGLAGLLLHETVRQVAVGAHRVSVAILADSVWLLSSVTILALVEFVGPGVTSAPQALAIWASGAWFGSLVVVVRYRLPALQLRASRKWLRHGLRDRVLLSIDPLLTAAVAQVVLVILVSGAGLEAIGLIRTVELAFGFVGVAVSATRLVGQPAYLRLRYSRRKLMWAVNASALAISGVVAATAIIWASIPDAWSESLLGERSADLSGVLLVGACYMATRSIPAPPFFALRVMRAVREVLVLRLWSAVLQIGAAVAAVAIASGSGANLMGILALGATVVAISCWVTLAAFLRTDQPDATVAV